LSEGFNSLKVIGSTPVEKVLLEFHDFPPTKKHIPIRFIDILARSTRITFEIEKKGGAL
jgi:hypothetical protein